MTHHVETYREDGNREEPWGWQCSCGAEEDGFEFLTDAEDAGGDHKTAADG